MDSETQGLITSAIIDAVILLILFILFTCYRKYRSKQISVSKDGGPPKNAAYDESTTSLGEIFGKVWRTSRGEFGALCGAES